MATSEGPRNVHRQPKGVPVGGQFTVKTNPESNLELSGVERAAADAVWSETRRATIAARRASMVREDARSAEVTCVAEHEYGGAAVIALLEQRERGTTPVDTSQHYLYRVAGIAGRLDMVPPGRSRRDYAGLHEYRLQAAAEVQRLGRHLTSAEEDALADDVRGGFAVGDRPQPGYHRPVTVSQLVGDVATESPPAPSVPAPGEDMVDRVVAQPLPARKKLALAVLATMAAASAGRTVTPETLLASISARRATIIRAEVAAGGGARAMAATWTGGETPLLAPFCGLTETQSSSIMRALAGMTDETADVLWRAAMRGAVRGIAAA